MKHELLPEIHSPLDLRQLSLEQMTQLAAEMRDVLCHLLSSRSAHFASNLGVVELCLALHSVFDFRTDRLIWDTGHQIYPHKLITGRYGQFATVRTKGGLMGYPNPAESDYDLFMTGHAGCSVSTVLGLRNGDRLLGRSDRHAVAVIGDGAFPSGIVYEALNNVGGMKEKLLIILNDNKMSICPRVGGMAEYLDKLRTNPLYTGFKGEVVKALNLMPMIGDSVERFLGQLKESVKAGLHGGMLFEDLGLRYIGPVDGHNLGMLRKYLEMVKSVEDPVLLHVFTEKGHGFQPAAADPVFFHTPPAFTHREGQAIPQSSGGSPAYTNVARDAIRSQMRTNRHVTVLTAAMCQGNKLEPVRDEFPDRFFDVGICESHAVAFAAGQAKAGLRPIVSIYSTFLQRSFDQIFQEVALQNLPVTFMMDRAGLTGPDGPTHHGVFDLAYMRIFPNMTVMVPGDSHDLSHMLDLALKQPGPCAIRYPKDTAQQIPGKRDSLRIGRAEVFSWGTDGIILCCGTLLAECQRACDLLRREGIDIGLVNARFVKPLDGQVLAEAFGRVPCIVTVEEAALAGGFGSAVLEWAVEQGLDTRKMCRLGIPDEYVTHGTRSELLAEVGLDVESMVRIFRERSLQSAAPVKRPDPIAKTMTSRA